MDANTAHRSSNLTAYTFSYETKKSRDKNHATAGSVLKKFFSTGKIDRVVEDPATLKAAAVANPILPKGNSNNNNNKNKNKGSDSSGSPRSRSSSSASRISSASASHVDPQTELGIGHFPG